MMGGREWSKIGEIVSRAREQGLSLKDAAKRAGIKVGLLYEYNRRESEERREEAGSDGGSGRESEEKRGSEVAGVVAAAASRLPAGVQDLIRAYRCEHPLEGFKRIADVLKQKHIQGTDPGVGSGAGALVRSATFPAPAASNGLCGFPALRSPDRFVPWVM